MKERGIGYKKPMILAKKAGIKGITRRPIKPPFEIHANGYITKPGKYERLKPYRCPYGKTGDLLYTKENFQIVESMDFERSVKVKYQADESIKWVQLTNDEWEKYQNWKEPYGKKSSLFMFKSLARYWDEITDIEAERVQDITLEEMKAEGTIITIRTSQEKGNILWPLGKKFSPIHYLPDGIFSNEKKHLLTEEMIYRAHFYALWDKMYAGTEYAIENNPWVWVIRYKPIDTEQKAMKEELENTGIL